MRWSPIRKNPRTCWGFFLEIGLPKELFIILEEVVSKTRYGLITVENCVFLITSRIQVRRVFCALTDQNLTKLNY